MLTIEVQVGENNVKYFNGKMSKKLNIKKGHSQKRGEQKMKNTSRPPEDEDQDA